MNLQRGETYYSRSHTGYYLMPVSFFTKDKFEQRVVFPEIRKKHFLLLDFFKCAEFGFNQDLFWFKVLFYGYDIMGWLVGYQGDLILVDKALEI